MSTPLPDHLGPYQRYATTVRRLRQMARQATAAGDQEGATSCRHAIATMREQRGMKGRRNQ